MRKKNTQLTGAPAVVMQRRVSRRREEQALEALVALALRHDQDGISDAEISKYMSQPTRLSKADQAALDRARPKLLAALRKELRPDTKRYMAAWGKPANADLRQDAGSAASNVK